MYGWRGRFGLLGPSINTTMETEFWRIAPPFYALGPVKSYVVFTDGGLKVSEHLEVLRGDGSVIPGLYAAVAAGQGGLLLEGHGHHLGWSFISGHIVGRNAAFEVRGESCRTGTTLTSVPQCPALRP